MTAAENLSLAADLARETAVYESATTQHNLMGRVFDYSQPLPPMPHYRPREWETRVEYFGRLQVIQPAKNRNAA